METDSNTADFDALLIPCSQIWPSERVNFGLECNGLNGSTLAGAWMQYSYGRENSNFA